MEGLGPFGLAGFGRIWGYVGLCCLVGALPGDRNVARGHAKRERNGGPVLRRITNGVHVIQSPVRLVHYCFLQLPSCVQRRCWLLNVLIAVRVHCAGWCWW